MKKGTEQGHIFFCERVPGFRCMTQDASCGRTLAHAVSSSLKGFWDVSAHRLDKAQVRPDANH